MQDDDDAFAVQAAIAQRTRWSILNLLAGATEGVEAGEIIRRLDVTKSNLSMQMGVLSRAGLITAETRGRYVVYSLVRDRLAAAGDVLRSLALRGE